MWILVITYAALVLGESIVIGLATAGVCRRLGLVPATRLVFPLFVAVFIVLETFYLPAVHVLDLRIEIRSPEFAYLIGPGTPIVLSELLKPSAEDALWWILQASIAVVAFRLGMRPPSLKSSARSESAATTARAPSEDEE